MVKSVDLKNGDYTLRGIYSKGESEKVVIMFHGYTGHKVEHNGMFRSLSRILLKEDISSLRFDYYGNFDSDGEFTDFTFDTLFSDARCIIKYAYDLGYKEVILLGYSMGGALALAVAHEEARIKKVVVWNPAGNINELVKRRYEIAEKDEKGNTISLNFSLSKAMFDSSFKYEWYKLASQYQGKAYVIKGAKDLAVPLLYNDKYLEVLKNKVSFIIKDGDHGFDNKKDQELLYKKTIEYIKEEES